MPPAPTPAPSRTTEVLRRDAELASAAAPAAARSPARVALPRRDGDDVLHAPMKVGKDWQTARYSALLRATAAPEERTDDDRALRKGACSRVRGAAAFAILRQLLPLLEAAASLGAAPLACPFAPLAQLLERFGKALPGRLPVASGEPEQRQHDRREEADEDPH